MARILNRPMFRRGGSTGGITANLKKPRVGLNLGGPPEMTDTPVSYTHLTLPTKA